MKDGLKFGLKAYFGGCFGCLGALTTLLVLILVFTLVLGPTAMGSMTPLMQSFPSILSQGIPGMGAPMQNDADNMEQIAGTEAAPHNDGNSMQQTPLMEVYLTIGNDPGGKHITSFSSAQYEQIWFWVRSPQGTATTFTLLLTMPNKSQVQFGPQFSSDPSGEPVPCGQFGDQGPESGEYKLEVTTGKDSASAGAIEFTVTE